MYGRTRCKERRVGQMTELARALGGLKRALGYHPIGK